MPKHRENKMRAVTSALQSVAFATGAFFGRIGAAVKRGISSLAHRIAALLHIKQAKSYADMDDQVSEHTQVFDSVNGHNAAAKGQKKAHKEHIIPHISRDHLSGEGKEHINMFRPRRNKEGIFLGITLTSVKLIIVAIMMFGGAGIGTLVGVAKAYMETTPKLDTGKIEDQSETSYIFDGNGNLITAYTGIENRDRATIEEMPLQLQQAFKAIEDVRFDYHSGVDVKRLVSSFISNMTNSSVQGGSTITQQLIKNRLLSFERTYKRKIQEAYLAIQLEQTYSKEEILEAYMNTIHLGGSNYGVKAAAMDYFGKDLDQLSLRECAMLAGITQYPYQYNPRRCYYVTKQPEIVNKRTDEVLRKMYTASFISLEQYNAALNESVFIIEESKISQMYDMPYFVEYAVYDVITHFLKQRNMQDTKQNRAQIETELRTNGYRIYTTVDPKIQRTVEESLANWDQYPRLANAGDAIVRDESSGAVNEIVQPQAAAVVVEQRTGDLKAVVGGRTTPTAKKTLNRAYQNKMPIGSSIKPIAVYAPAIDKGYSDGTVVPNLPVPIPGWKMDDGVTDTYPAGGSSKYGPVTLRSGLVNSLNSATAYTLLDLVTIQDSYNYLVQMGINPSDINQTGAGLALGSSGISPIELAGAYATIANGGVYLEPLSFRYVEDRNGNVILDADQIREKRRVFEESTAWLVTDMLVDAVQNGTGKRARIPDMTIGGKTGTNQQSRGILFAGISPYYTSTLWIGHDLYKPLHKDVYASSSAAPLWKDYMSKILEGMENRPILDSTPAELGLVQRTVCAVSGKLATDACSADLGEHTPVSAWFVAGTEPAESCDWHMVYTVCSHSGKIATAFCPEESIGASKSVLLLPSDSIYWKLTDEQRNKYLPGILPAFEPGQSLHDLDPNSPLYASYFCDIHTLDWYNAQLARADSVSYANAQISVSESVLSNPAYVMSSEHRTQLSNGVKSLRDLINNASATAAAIDQSAHELKSLTDMLVALYTPLPQPETP